MKVFEVLFVYRVTEEQKKSGEKDRILGEMVRVLAKDAQSALIMASREVKELADVDASQVEALVRNF